MSNEIKATILGSDQVTLRLDEPKTDYIKVHYHVPHGCKPTAFNHAIAYWKNCTDLDFNIPPTDVFPVTTDSGVQTINLSLGVGAHVFAYSTNPYSEEDYKVLKSSFCAVGYVDPYNKRGFDNRINEVQLELVEYDEETVSVKAKLPQTYRPCTSCNWVGIWEGGFSYGTDPTAFAKVNYDKTEVTTVVNIELKRNQDYEIAYGMGGYCDTGITQDARMKVAATLAFRI